MATIRIYHDETNSYYNVYAVLQGTQTSDGDGSVDYYLVISTDMRDVYGASLPTFVVRSLTDVAPGYPVRTDFTALVNDYISWFMVQGELGQSSSSSSESTASSSESSTSSSSWGNSSSSSHSSSSSQEYSSSSSLADSSSSSNSSSSSYMYSQSTESSSETPLNTTSSSSSSFACPCFSDEAITMTSNTTPSPYIVNVLAGGNDADCYKVFDKDPGTYYEPVDNGGVFWYDFSTSPQVIDQFRVKITNAFALSDMVLIVRGSNDAAIWKELWQFTNLVPSDWEESTLSVCGMGNETSYRFYSFDWTTVFGEPRMLLNTIELSLGCPYDYSSSSSSSSSPDASESSSSSSGGYSNSSESSSSSSESIGNISSSSSSSSSSLLG